MYIGNSTPVVQSVGWCTAAPSLRCQRGLDVIRKEAWSFYRTISGVHLCWELEEPKGPKGQTTRWTTDLSPKVNFPYVMNFKALCGTSLVTLPPELWGDATFVVHRRASHQHCTAGSSRSFTAIRKDAGLCCGSRLRKGEVFAYVGRNQNLKDLKVRRLREDSTRRSSPRTNRSTEQGYLAHKKRF